MAKSISSKSFQKILMEQAKKVANESVYCRICGMDIKHPTAKAYGDEKDWRKNLNWELYNQVHVSCVRSKGK